MKFRKQDVANICDEDIEGFFLVEQGDWISDGKYQRRISIFSFGGHFYQVENSRCGSYHSDYWYESEDWPEEVECPEVERKKVVTIKWDKVKS